MSRGWIDKEITASVRYVIGIAVTVQSPLGNLHMLAKTIKELMNDSGVAGVTLSSCLLQRWLSNIHVAVETFPVAGFSWPYG